MTREREPGLMYYVRDSRPEFLQISDAYSSEGRNFVAVLRGDRAPQVHGEGSDELTAYADALSNLVQQADRQGQRIEMEHFALLVEPDTGQRRATVVMTRGQDRWPIVNRSNGRFVTTLEFGLETIRNGFLQAFIQVVRTDLEQDWATRQMCAALR